MMYRKALLFGDAEVAERIMLAITPKEHKALGRKVKNFDGTVWDARREGIRRGRELEEILQLEKRCKVEGYAFGDR